MSANHGYHDQSRIPDACCVAYNRGGEPTARVPNVARWPNFNGTGEKSDLSKLKKRKDKKFE